jgi:very-short-patch-repair endonuclease
MTDPLSTSPESKVICQICEKEFGAITHSHLIIKHNITIKEYQKQFPDALLGGNYHTAKERIEYINSTPHLTKLRKENSRKACQTIEYKQQMSEISKVTATKLKERGFYDSEAVQSRITGWQRMSNYERWIIEFGQEEADKKQIEWADKNTLPTASSNTKIERIIMSVLENYNIEYLHQYKGVPSIIADFYLPEFNLIIECDGDYWHCNPIKYKEEYVVGPKKLSAKQIWEHDEIKNQKYIVRGYNLLRLWENDIKRMTEEQLYGIITNYNIKKENE